ncbi:MAG: winged helix-turn-helix transcriptional regulator [Lachnospiraceae bacterium]|nr:winged helix-turn-helix transcriptional regulator [Lachnospiraceae bacterium]
MIIVTFSDSEEQVVEKLKAVLVEDQEIECISITDDKEMIFGDVEIRTKQRKVFLKGKEIELTTREFDVLYTLAYYHDQVLTTRQIYKAITGEDVMDDYHGIESSIYSIRKKLGHDIILNIRGYGYQLKKER